MSGIELEYVYQTGNLLSPSKGIVNSTVSRNLYRMVEGKSICIFSHLRGSTGRFLILYHHNDISLVNIYLCN